MKCVNCFNMTFVKYYNDTAGAWRGKCSNCGLEYELNIEFDPPLAEEELNEDPFNIYDDSHHWTSDDF